MLNLNDIMGVIVGKEKEQRKKLAKNNCKRIF